MADDDESFDGPIEPINARIMAREMAQDEENEAMEEWEALGNDPDDFTMAVRARAFGARARARGARRATDARAVETVRTVRRAALPGQEEGPRSRSRRRARIQRQHRALVREGASLLPHGPQALRALSLIHI